ncbi:hypothetical protein [Micromonospora sp. CPCC 206061]|uniref:hypothetical protein n=1 Tax=Micromonospora sp. CPCC 206061 TaxID=3122410 RepID=UPI002FF4338E
MPPNDKLRKAREDRGMGRPDLVAAVNTVLYGEPKSPFSAFTTNYLGKLEKGRIRRPGDDYRSALREVLHCTDADLGFEEDPRPRLPEETIPAAATHPGLPAGIPLLGTSLDDLLGRPRPGEPPRCIGRDHITQIVDVANFFEHWDNTHGGAAARDIADDRLRHLASWISVPCPASLRLEFHTALAHLAGVVGFMLFDAYEHDEARRRFGFALHCATDNWHQRAMLLSSMARQEIWCRRPDDGLTYVEMGLVRADRLTATERAMMHTVRARALAKLGPDRAQEALKAVGAADEEFTHSNPAEDPVWMRFYDVAQHHGDTAHALFDVAVNTSLETEAVSRFARAVELHAPEYARSRAISRTKLATLTMAQGDPQEAAQIGHEALNDAGPVRSRRATDDLRALYRVAGKHAGIEEVDALRERLLVTVGAAA